MSKPRLTLMVLFFAAACETGGGGAPGEDPVDAPEGPHAVLRRVSRSTSIAVTQQDTRVIMVNPQADSASVFDTATDALVAEVPTGREPSSVVIHPDDTRAFVANAGDATVVRIDGLDGGSPAVGATLEVGSEPTGLALSPSGARLYVAEFAEGRVAVIDTATMTEVGAVTTPRNPRGIAITNDGDQDDDDELLIVPEFFGEPVGEEATDASRQARVRIYALADGMPTAPIQFAPFDSGFAPSTAPAGAPTVSTSPNQLWTVEVVGNTIYIPAISASPDRPANFQANVFPTVLVGDLESRTEVRGGVGTQNLARLVRDQLPAPVAPTDPARFFLADPVDIAFVNKEVGYVVSRGADVMQRIVYKDGATTLGGTPFNKQIDLNVTPEGSPGPCQNPTGMALAHNGGRAWVNCWGTRRLGVVDFSMQKLARTVASSQVSAEQRPAQLGLHFFFTGRGRWSSNSWSSCGSCHPDGRSDNVTWSFAAGPRQSTSLDGSYSRGAIQRRRALNWTGIFDEIHDFERNTRDVQGGKGAITRPDPAIAGAACGTLAQEAVVVLSADGLGRSVKLDQDGAGTCTKDWDSIDAYVKNTVRPPGRLRKLDSASVARGAELFGEPTAQAANAGCVRCHGGPGWTVSRVHFAPAAADPSALNNITFAAPTSWPPSNTTDGWNFQSRQIAVQPASALFAGPEATTTLAPRQVSCVLRNVGTFGADTLETRVVRAADGTVNLQARAQGRLGYNVPSLYGMALGAPFFHHGKAATLEAMLDDSAWSTHATAGNPNWLLQGSDAQIAQRKTDLLNFLLSIDPATPEQSVPAGFDGCP
ncbi:MAG TPA: YncE family protein [Kofleriaceae bacterium]|nr:YncE family protein [Kofleriaceae bacterium]